MSIGLLDRQKRQNLYYNKLNDNLSAAIQDTSLIFVSFIVFLFLIFFNQLRYLLKLSSLFKFNRLVATAGSTEIDWQKRKDVYNKAD